MRRSENRKTPKPDSHPSKDQLWKKPDPAITAYAVQSLNWLRQAEFLMSAPKLALCVEDSGYEIAFAGRSNAGKSSAINALTNQKQLARASKNLGARKWLTFQPR